jgi:addiction module HigA family antidote
LSNIIEEQKMTISRAYKVRSTPRMRPPHPGSLLRIDILPALGIPVAEAARELGVSRQLLHGILAEKYPVSAETAVRLGKWCGNGAHLWIALQRDFDLWQAQRKLGAAISAIPTHEAA